MKAARKILNNMIFLSAAEIASKGITTITIIYLARVLTPEGMGTISFITSIVAYFIAFTNLGIDTIATREVTKNQNLTEPYVNVLFSLRLILSLVSFLGLIFFVQILNQPFEVQLLWYISGINIFSQSLLLNWYFVAIEKMQIIALRQLLIGILNFTGVIIFVHNPQDILIAIIINSSVFVVNSLWMIFYYLKHYFSIKFNFDLQLIKSIMKPALPLGFSLILITIYNNINISILGFIKGEYETGLFSAAFKIHTLGLIPIGIIQTSFFPILSRQEDKQNRIKVASKYALLLFIVGCFYTILIFTYSYPIVEIVFGDEYINSYTTLKLLMVTLLIQFCNMSMASPLMAWKKEKLIMKATIITTIVNITSNFLLIPKYGADGAAIASLISEFVIFLIMAINIYGMLKWLPHWDFTKTILLSLLAVGLSYAVYVHTQSIVYPIIIALIIYPILIFLTKLITIKQLREYFSK